MSQRHQLRSTDAYDRYNLQLKVKDYFAKARASSKLYRDYRKCVRTPLDEAAIAKCLDVLEAVAVTLR